MAVTLTAELIFLTLPAAALTLDFRRSPSAGELVYRQVDLKSYLFMDSKIKFSISRFDIIFFVLRTLSRP